MLARILDILLIACAAFTVALILWKVLELYLPGLLGRVRLEARARTEAELDEVLEHAERGLPLLATIAATAPFVGLAATVLHIMHALQMLDGSSVEASILGRPDRNSAPFDTARACFRGARRRRLQPLRTAPPTR